VQKGLLANVGRELVARHGEQLAVQEVDDAATVSRLAVLDHELDDIVAVLILHEDIAVQMELVEEGPRAVLRKMLEASLKDSTAVRMLAELQHLAAEGLHKAQAIGGNALQELLNDVVPMRVVDADHDVVRLKFTNHIALLLESDVLHSLDMVSDEQAD
jgi:hypothetical protein